ncbi:hypothetical protein G9A89_002146 [Geosiphon pyriformis]|nr:hypothetical protein G9A89_002146 [Geosiphon pyriformis]
MPFVTSIVESANLSYTPQERVERLEHRIQELEAVLSDYFLNANALRSLKKRA